MHHSPLIVLVLWLLTVAGTLNPLPLLFPRLPVVVFISTASRQLIRHELHVLLARDESLSKGWYIIEVASSSPNLGERKPRFEDTGCPPLRRESVSSPSPQVTVMSSYIPLSQREPGLDLNGRSEGGCRRRFSLATALRCF